MSIREKIRDSLEGDEIALLFEPEMFDAAIIGIAQRCGQQPLVAYDRQRCIDVLASNGMDPEEAEEYFELNTAGAWVGEGTPVIITTIERCP